jgi:hypothetical protein
VVVAEPLTKMWVEVVVLVEWSLVHLLQQYNLTQLLWVEVVLVVQIHILQELAEVVMVHRVVLRLSLE